MEIKHWITYQLQKNIHPIGLAVFRFAFGMLMLISGIRFLSKGWLHDFYVKPDFFFKYYGFSWVTPLPELGLYILFLLMLLAALCMALGYKYRPAAVAFFVLFNYFELLDKTYYLNHYYLVSILSFWMIFVPANAYASIDIYFNKAKTKLIPKYWILGLQLQIALVYIFAGIAKIDSDWLLHAMPLKIWLQRFNPATFWGQMMHSPFSAYIAAWFGCIYDCCIVFFLWNHKTRKWAYLTVIIFHLATWLLFPIGMFPFIMMVATLLFFPNHNFRFIKKILPKKGTTAPIKNRSFNTKFNLVGLSLLLAFQILFPLRSLLYPGNVLWHEQGFNFSWRVMRVEKAGTALFTVTDANNNQTWEVINSDFLSPQQEKMMAIQPDLILQFAKHLGTWYQNHHGIDNPIVKASVYVSYNGKKSELLINPDVNLQPISDGWKNKEWIMPFTP